MPSHTGMGFLGGLAEGLQDPMSYAMFPASRYTARARAILMEANPRAVTDLGFTEAVNELIESGSNLRYSDAQLLTRRVDLQMARNCVADGDAKFADRIFAKWNERDLEACRREKL